jgi:hypothetical protein
MLHQDYANNLTPFGQGSIIVMLPKFNYGGAIIFQSLKVSLVYARVKEPGMQQTTHLNLVLRLRMCGPVTSLSHILSRYCAQIHTGTVLLAKCHCIQYRPDSEVLTAMYLTIKVFGNVTCCIYFDTGEEGSKLL